MNIIKGEDRDQITLFPDTKDNYISDDNPVRVIDAYIDSLDLKKLGFVNIEPNKVGAPMYPAKTMLKIYVYGYMNKIRSSRKLENETIRNVEMMWLTKKLTPDHKTISRFRQNNPNALKNVFKNFNRLISKLGLFGKELLAVDGSRFKAVNSKENNYNQKKIADRIQRLDQKINTYMESLDKNDEEESNVDKKFSAEEINQIIEGLNEQKKQYEDMAAKLEETEETQISTVDPDARRMSRKYGNTDVGYNIQTAVDSKYKMLAEFDVTNSITDYGHLSTTAEKAKELLEVESIKTTADKGYDSATDIAECLMNGIEPHVTMDEDITICIEAETDEREKITTQSNGRIVYIKDRNIAICPMGKILYPSSFNKKKKEARFLNKKACNRCDSKCCKSKHKFFSKRMKQKDWSKSYNDQDLKIKQVTVKRDLSILKKRKAIVEHPFGTIKRAFDSGYCLTKGLNNVVGEFSLTFLAYNLKRAINILGSKQLVEVITTL